MNHPESRGFTLMELLIVLAVMGIVSVMLIPAMTNLNGSVRLAGARNELMTDLRYAHSLSTSQRRTYDVRPTTNGYAVVCLSPLQTMFTRSLPRGVAIASTDTTRFYAWGLTRTSAITLSQGQHSAVVRMTATGQVTHD